LGRNRLSAVGRLLVANVNALLFLGGFVAFTRGVSAVAGTPVAWMVGGVIVMLVAVWPFLRTTKGARG